MNSEDPHSLFKCTQGEWHMVSRRDFLKLSAAGMAALYVTKRAKSLLHTFASAQSDNLGKFFQPLRMPGTCLSFSPFTFPLFTFPFLFLILPCSVSRMDCRVHPHLILPVELAPRLCYHGIENGCPPISRTVGPP
jgi:TAT (twin-arginine translocation) pathway signal sequence